ncbi:uncharacterized protein LOC110709551 [Chenopodium quinoa]|uniref:uncharacterized protein LOC110709551 n=1 Tax=Chenopodium quinoa TaxID=63459 RepID=UPI000B78F975|nr:uncharacterized protein LOC110709551 [Chenopodium quinoa]
MEAPPLTSFKLNFDGSVKNNSAAAGVIIRDSDGTPITTQAFNLGTTNAIVAEAFGLHKGIILALQQGIQNLQIEGDNLLVVNAVNEKQIEQQIGLQILDILSPTNWIFLFVPPQLCTPFSPQML